MFSPRVWSVWLLSAVVGSSAHAATAWDESLSGDFANLGSAPTAVSFVSGSNVVRGSTGRSSGVVDRDYFTFTLLAGWQIDSLTVMPGSTFIGASFIAIQTGPQVTVNPTGNSSTGLLGWLHFTENDLGTDILGLMGIGFGAVGFSAPLPAGVYSIWIQDTGTGTARYNLDFGVSVVPEPATGALLAAGLAGLAAFGAAQRRRAGEIESDKPGSFGPSNVSV